MCCFASPAPLFVPCIFVCPTHARRTAVWTAQHRHSSLLLFFFLLFVLRRRVGCWVWVYMDLSACLFFGASGAMSLADFMSACLFCFAIPPRWRFCGFALLSVSFRLRYPCLLYGGCIDGRRDGRRDGTVLGFTPGERWLSDQVMGRTDQIRDTRKQEIRRRTSECENKPLISREYNSKTSSHVKEVSYLNCGYKKSSKYPEMHNARASACVRPKKKTPHTLT